MAKCNTCQYAGRPTYKSPCSECKDSSQYEHKKIRTRVDRLRAMSDEELVDLIFKYELDMTIPFCKDLPECSERMDAGTLDYTECRKCMLEYLRQPSEEGENRK